MHLAEHSSKATYICFPAYQTQTFHKVQEHHKVSKVVMIYAQLNS